MGVTQATPYAAEPFFDPEVSVCVTMMIPRLADSLGDGRRATFNDAWDALAVKLVILYQTPIQYAI